MRQREVKIFAATTAGSAHAMRVCPFKPKIHRASAATLALPIALPLSFEYIMMLGNGSGTTSPRHHRPALAAVAVVFTRRVRFGH